MHTNQRRPLCCHLFGSRAGYTNLTLTIPVSNPDNLTYEVNVQVQGW